MFCCGQQDIGQHLRKLQEKMVAEEQNADRMAAAEQDSDQEFGTYAAAAVAAVVFNVQNCFFVMLFVLWFESDSEWWAYDCVNLHLYTVSDNL